MSTPPARTSPSDAADRAADGVVLTGVAVADSAESWRAAGFRVVDGTVSIPPLLVHLESERSEIAWELRAPGSAPSSIDGVPTAAAPEAIVSPEAEDPSSRGTEHPNGVFAIDHVVVFTPDLPRTIDAFAELGLEPRRVRPIGDRSQAFFWLGPVIVEIVGPSERTGAEEPARVWGLAVVSDDLDHTADVLGEALGSPGDAVQPGRRIATVRTGELGISLALAIMTPHA